MTEAHGPIPNALSIAGVDPSGGAGLIADLKTFAALGAYGCGVVTALTAQNTCVVAGIEEVTPAFLGLQLRTLFDDVRVDTVKIGMVASTGLVHEIADALERYRPRFVVLDPVMVAKSGDHLLREEAVEALRRRLVPLATVLTPNLPEAETLLGRPVTDDAADMRSAARELASLGAGGVLVKGGHGSGSEVVDVFFGGGSTVEFRAPRLATRNTHGTGCTLSSAIAALLPRSRSAMDATREATRYVHEAIRHAGELDVGHGHGPLNHLHALRPVQPGASHP